MGILPSDDLFVRRVANINLRLKLATRVLKAGTAAALAVLVAASQVGSAQAYNCTNDAQCQYSPCNDQPCSSSDSYCVNGKWRAFCVSCTPITEAPRTILIPFSHCL